MPRAGSPHLGVYSLRLTITLGLQAMALSRAPNDPDCPFVRRGEILVERDKDLL